MRSLIIYFSGTGNTRRISELMQAEFEKHDSQCQLLAMEDIILGRQEPDYSDWDIIGIGFPVHAMDAPKIVYDFLEILPKSRSHYFLFKTAGSKMLNAGSTYRIRKHLAFLGWRLIHEQLYEMPPNAFGTANPKKVTSRYLKARDLTQTSVVEIIGGIKHRVPDPLFRSACYQFAAFEKHGASQASKRWTANSSCTLCGLCEKQCPTNNIRIEDGKLIFGDNCLLCLRCWWNCPNRAISHSFLKPFFLKEPYILPQMEPETGEEQ